MSSELGAILELLNLTVNVGSLLEEISKLEDHGIFELTEREFEFLEQGASYRLERYPIKAADVIRLSHHLATDLVDDLRENLKKIKKDISDTYKDTGLGTHDKQRQAHISTRDFCWNLNQIKKHNGGNLPPDLSKE